MNATFNRLCALITALLITVAGQSHATLINLDLQSRSTGAQTEMSGAAAIGSAGDSWNHVNFANGGGGSLVEDLFDSSGDPTTVDFSIGGFADVGGFVTINNSDVQALMGDYIFIANGGGTATAQISGLNPNEDYTLVLYGLGDNAFRPDTATFNVTGSNEGVLSTTGNNNGALATPDHYVTFTGNTGTGTIDFTWTGNPGVFSGFNGFQLETTAIPEPSTLVIGAVCFMGLIAARKRSV